MACLRCQTRERREICQVFPRVVETPGHLQPGGPQHETLHIQPLWFGVLPGTGFLARVGTLPWTSGSLSEMDNLTPTTGEGWVSGQVVLAGPSPSGLWPPSLHSGWCLDVQWVIPDFPNTNLQMYSYPGKEEAAEATPWPVCGVSPASKAVFCHTLPCLAVPLCMQSWPCTPWRAEKWGQAACLTGGGVEPMPIKLLTMALGRQNSCPWEVHSSE